MKSFHCYVCHYEGPPVPEVPTRYHFDAKTFDRVFIDVVSQTCPSCDDTCVSIPCMGPLLDGLVDGTLPERSVLQFVDGRWTCAEKIGDRQ